ncbi:MAG: LacI family transcriptional regulator [Lachnospiraceae bacterium]|jgi:LacI family transcriptional regulator|nr:LacI family transcriptional regulator [Lachnospiraceae bacterium]NBJ81170.1 LacI family transcriptional regulator [bacterium 1XD42-76]NBK04613.1 LacI family transcriptional regulator [bacterium 1XD42-94]
MKTKITDVAKQAGVSIATVSHVINGTRHVTDATRKKVEDAIHILDYSPDISARGLKTGKKNLVGLITPDLGNRFFSLILEEIEDELSLHGYNAVVVNTRENCNREVSGLKLLTSGITDGIIIASSFQNYRDIATYIPKGFPSVHIDRLPRGYQGDSVRVSSFSAVKEATADLLREGHIRIGYIASLARLSSTEERLQGYECALKEAGLSLDPALIKQGDSHSRSGYLCMQQLVEEGVRAVFISNSLMASGALTYLDNCGMRIGQDIQVASMRDYEWHRFQRESIRTVEQPGREMARLAARRILERIERPDEAGSEILLQATYHKEGEHSGTDNVFPVF